MKGGDGLGTIFEEIDLSERIQSLKGKKIRIKRMVRKEDGSYSLKESFVNGDTDRLVSRPLPAPSAQPRRFRSTDRRVAANRDMSFSVYYDRLVGGQSGDRMNSSQSSMRQSLSLSRALCFEEEEATRLPPLVGTIEASIKQEEEGLELSRLKAQEAVRSCFNALLESLSDRIRATTERLCARIDDYYQRLKANMSDFISLLSQFHEEETCVVAGEGGRVPTICKSFRLFENRKLLRDEPVNALLTVPRVRLEGLKRVLGYAAEKWATLGSGYCVFAAGETAREAVSQESRALLEAVGAGLSRLEEFYHESELKNISALHYRAELEPLPTPSFHSLVHNTVPAIKPATVLSRSVRCFGVSERLIAWTASPATLKRFAVLRSSFEQVACPDSFSPSKIQIFSCYPEKASEADPRSGRTSRRDHLLLLQMSGPRNSVALFDPLTGYTSRDWALSALPVCVVPLKDGFSFIVLLEQEISFFSRDEELPLQVISLPAIAVSLHLSAGLTLAYLVFDDRSVGTVQLNYAYSRKCGRVVLENAELSGLFEMSEQLHGISELTLRERCLLGLCVSGGLQLFSTESLRLLESLDLPHKFSQMRILENPIALTTHALLVSHTHTGIYDFNNKKLVSLEPISSAHSYAEISQCAFALLPSLHLMLEARVNKSEEKHLLAIPIE